MTPKPPNPQLIGRASIQDIDGNEMTYEQVGQPLVKLDLGVPCDASGEINLYDLGRW